jgi:hypothetical protein
MDCSEFEGSSVESRGSSLASARLRAALAGGAAVAMVLGALGAANAAVQSKPPHAKREQPKKEPPPKPLDAPLIEVSISKQQLTLYENGAPVAHSPVSTGMAGHSTPTGIFSVIGKEIFHRSNIYSGAPMPYMQRITWSGVAMHAGVLPGYPASHGCIRLPHDFAVRLFSLTRMGARVLVMPHEVAPVPFENARLFTRPKPATDKVSDAAPPAADTRPVHVVRTAESRTPVMSDAADAAAHTLSDLAKPKVAEAAAPTPAEVVKARTPAPAEAAAPTPAEVVKARTPAPAEPAAPTPAEVVKARTPAPAETAASEPLAEGLKSAATTAATEATQAAEAANADDAKYLAAAGPAGEPTTGTVVVKPVAVTSPQPIEVRKSFEPVTGPREGTQTFQPTPPAAQPVQAAPAVAPAQVPPAPVQAAQPAPAPEAKPESNPAPAVTAAANEFYGPERPLRPGPITVFVSKKEGKLFVRKGFQPVFSWPVKFAQPERPLGTHLYTAVDANPDGVSYRWQVVSVPVDTTRKAEKHVSRDKKGHRIETMVQPAVAPPAATAAEALERIDIPPVVLTRISALMSKGASLIISDQGLGGETGTETDFIVLTR